MNRTILVLVTTLALAACTSEKPTRGSPSTTASDGRAVVQVAVNATGYDPTEVRAPAGKPARIVFTRMTDEGCGQQVVFPDLNIRKDLPLKQAVSIDVTMPPSGKLAFACGMGMLHGAVIAQ